jgi:hypothetical protein
MGGRRSASYGFHRELNSLFLTYSCLFISLTFIQAAAAVCQLKGGKGRIQPWEGINTVQPHLLRCSYLTVDSAELVLQSKASCYCTVLFLDDWQFLKAFSVLICLFSQYIIHRTSHKTTVRNVVLDYRRVVKQDHFYTFHGPWFFCDAAVAECIVM